MEGLRQRVISAIFFFIIVLLGVYGGTVPLVILHFLIAGLCAKEFFQLTNATLESKNLIRIILGILTSLAPLTYFFLSYFEYQAFAERLLLIAPAWVSLLFIFELFQTSKAPFERMGNYLLSVGYIGVPLALLASLIFHNNEVRPNIFMGILVLIWLNDSFAYFTGKRFGKNKLYPRISPGKTWEGTIGGAVFTLAFSYVVFMIFNDFSFEKWAGIALIVAVFGTIGDLVESMLKRSKGVKDSGKIMPGHGGALDRFDSFIFVLPFVWVFIKWIEN